MLKVVPGALAKGKVHDAQALERVRDTDTLEKIYGTLEGVVTGHDECPGQHNPDDCLRILCEDVLT